MVRNLEPVQFHVLHETRYDYAQTVSLSQQLLYLQPRSFDFQQCLAHSITINPGADERVDSIDYFGNHVQYVSIADPHDTLVVTAESRLQLTPRPGHELFQESLPWQDWRSELSQISSARVSNARLEALKFLYESPHVTLSDELAGYARTSFTPNQSLLGAAFDLTERIYSDFTFDAEATDISTPLSELFETRRGVCQDFAHFMIGCLRSIGLSCRYVSGYILTHPAPGKPRLVGADASHAWVSVYCPTIGWVDFDPTNRCMVNLEHITLGWGRDFSDVSLLRGIMLGGGEQTLNVSVTMTPVTLESNLPIYL